MSNKVELKKTVDLTEATQLLEDLVSSLKVGTVCVQKGANHVTVTPLGDLELEIEARQKKGKESLVIELGWEMREETPDEKTVEEFRISPVEPEPAVNEEETIA